MSLKEPYINISLVYAQFVCGKFPVHKLPQVAIDIMKDGYTSDYWLTLAQERDETKIPDLFHSALHDQNVTPLDITSATYVLMREQARVINGYPEQSRLEDDDAIYLATLEILALAIQGHHPTLVAQFSDYEANFHDAPKIVAEAIRISCSTLIAGIKS